MTTKHSFDNLVTIMQKLRDPKGGCPWDLEQNFSTIIPYTIEEAYEVKQAIQDNDMESLCEELGDLLLQVIFHAQMAKENHHFTIDDVIHGIAQKMIDRHPHVFGDATITTADEQVNHWEALKQKERDKKNNGLLNNLPKALPALKRAEKIQNRVAKVGFDWPKTENVFDKIKEECEELTLATDPIHQKEECGDLLFAVTNLVRKYGFDPEACLDEANEKFIKRFNNVEELADKKPLNDYSLDELEALWQKVKKKA